MACNVEACGECTHKCLSLLGNKTKLAPVITSFFKIMIGSQCDEVLFFPPKFASTVSELIDQKTFLEDSSGQQWEVTISTVNGSFAFRQGWNTFFLDHNLKVGDFVVFNYIVGSHFVVRIYTDTGCEKLDFPETRNKRKRPRANENYTAKDDDPLQTVDKSSMTKGGWASVVSGSDVEATQSQCKMNDVGEVNVKVTSNCETSSQKPHSQSIGEYVEEPYYIIDRDFADKQGEDRGTMFDLSNFEMLTNYCVTHKSHKGDEICTHQSDASPKSQIEATLANKDPELQDALNRVVPSNASDLELMETSNDLKQMDKIVTVSNKISCDSKISERPLFTTVVKPAENGKSIPNVSNGVVKNDLITEEQGKAKPEIHKVIKSQNKYTSLTHISQSAQLKFTGKLESDVPITNGMLDSHLGGSMKIVKEELIETTGGICRCRDKKIIEGKAPQINEVEVDCGQRSDLIVRKNIAHPPVKIGSLEAISCVIASADEPFLELPSCLQYLKIPGRHVRTGRNVVYLRDPYMRIWPVLYLERSGFKLLSSGWEEFSKANNIKAGDQCIFGVDYNSESTCEVNIVRSKTSAPVVPLKRIECLDPCSL